MADYEIEVPIKIKGGKGGKKIGESIAEQIKKSLGAIGLGKEKAGGGIGIGGKGALKIAGTLGAILGVLDAINFILKPVLSLLKVIIMLLFLPLIPILKPAMIGLAKFIKWFQPKMTTLTRWVQKVADFFSGDFGNKVLAFLGLKGLWNQLRAGWEALASAGQWIWDQVLKPAFNFLKDVGIWIWEGIIQPAWMFLKDVGMWIWNQIIFPAWNYLKDVGSWVWDIIKSPWSWLAGKIRGIWDWIKDALSNMVPSWLGGGRKDDFISRPGQSPVAFNPSDTIIGVKDISKLGGGAITININNPTVRQTSDIKSIANEVSMVLQRRMTGRISQ